MLYKDCAKCKHLWDEVSQRGNCRGTAEWWHLNEIWLCRIQVMFLIDNLGAYPPDPHISGYTEAPHVSTRIGANAPYEAEIVLWAEVRYRLERTNTEGKWLVREIERVGLSNPDWEFIIKHLPYEPQSALYYVAGWVRKRMPYKDWKRQKEERKLKGKTNQQNDKTLGFVRKT